MAHRGAHDGQEYGETGAAGLAFHFDEAMVLVHERLRDHQAESGTAFPARYEREEHPLYSTTA